MHLGTKAFVRTVIVWLAVLITAWLLWSGIYKPILLALGAVSCALTIWLAYRLGVFEDSIPLAVLPRLPGYWTWLMKEVAISSMEVARVVLDPRMPMSPTIVEFDALPKDPLGQAILGNSIILTPGTLTLDVHEGRLRVHSLTREGGEALLDGDFNRRVERLTAS
jgi:multicomponent Na+:H+ antiporter subunit E